MEMNNPNASNYNLRMTNGAQDNLPKHERPLRIKLGGVANAPVSVPKTEVALPAHMPKPMLHLPRHEQVESKMSASEAQAKQPARGNNVFINVNIYFSKSLAELTIAKLNEEAKEQQIPRSVPPQQTQAPHAEALRKSQEEGITPLRLLNRPIDSIRVPKPLPGPSNQISSLFDNSRSSDAENYVSLRKREPNEIKCACHHLHVNDNVKISRFSYKSQLRKIRARWAKVQGDFPIVFKRKLARFEDDSESVSINEIVDFSKKLIQPDCENDLFVVGEQY